MLGKSIVDILLDRIARLTPEQPRLEEMTLIQTGT